MRSALLLSAGLLIIAIAAAQGPLDSDVAPIFGQGPGPARGGPFGAGNTPEQQEEGTATISGSVADSVTGQPLGKANVTVFPRQNPRQRHSATTGPDGLFRIEKLPAGDYVVMAERNGYARLSRLPGERTQFLRLEDASSVSDLALRLEPAAVLTGRVSDRDGEPVEGVRVQAMRVQFSQGKRELLPAGSGVSDDRGEYRVYGLSPGRYYLQAGESRGPFGRGGFPGAMRGSTAAEEQRISTYYPGARDASAAIPIALRPGDERGGLDIRLLSGRTIDISGTLSLPAQSGPGPQPFVLLVPANVSVVSFLDIVRAQVRSGGVFQLRGVQPGSYWLVAGTGGREGRLTAMESLEAGNTDIENVAVELQPGVPVNGQLRFEQTAGSALAVQVSPTLILEPVIRFQRLAQPFQAKPDPTGKFSFPEVSNGIFRLKWTGLEGGWYISSARMGGLDLLEQEFRVSPGAAGTPISVTLRPDGGTVQGLVAHSDGQPAKEAYLTLAPEDTAPLRDHLFHRTQADSNGRFQITGVAPGNYRLYAWESRDGVVDSDPDFLAQFASRSVTIQVRAAVVTEQQAVLIPADSPGLY